MDGVEDGLKRWIEVGRLACFEKMMGEVASN